MPRNTATSPPSEWLKQQARAAAERLRATEPVMLDPLGRELRDVAEHLLDYPWHPSRPAPEEDTGTLAPIISIDVARQRRARR